jgi:hypothetical protein
MVAKKYKINNNNNNNEVIGKWPLLQTQYLVKMKSFLKANLYNL